MRIEKHKLIAFLFFFSFWVCALPAFPIQEITGEINKQLLDKFWMFTEVVVIILGLWTLKATFDKVTIIIFFALGFIDSVIVNHLSVVFWLNGCRLYSGIIFMFPIVRYFWTDEHRRAYFVAKMDRTIYLYLVIQFPCMVVQCIRYGAWDLVSGSIGWMYTGTTSTIIYLSSFYLMVRRWDYSLTYLQNLKKNWVLLLLLFPSWINETKVSFIYISMYFFFLVPIDKKYFKRLSYLLPSMVLLVCGFGFIYYYMSVDKYRVGLDEIGEYITGSDIMLDLVEYAFENEVDEVNETDYARGLKFYILPEIYKRHENSWLTGFGVSQYKGGTTLEKTEFATKYFWLLQGTAMQWYNCLIDMGIPGALLYIIFWISAFRLWHRLPGRRNVRMTWMFGLTTLIFSVYIPPFNIPVFYMQFMFMVFTCSRWNELPPYKHVPLLGSKKIIFSRHD